MFDIVIIGAGPAGLSAATYACRAGLSCLILESNMYGGQITTTPDIENYPSIGKIAGWELANNLYEQAIKFGAEFHFESVNSIIDDGELKTVTTSENAYVCKSVIIATGAKRRNLGVEGEQEFVGKGVSFCACCDGSFYKGKIVVVFGGGNTALEDALYLSNICEKVYIIHRRNEYRAENYLVSEINTHNNIIQLLGYIPEKICGNDSVELVIIKNVADGSITEIKTNGVFVCIGLSPDNSAFSDVIKLDEKGYVIAGEDCRTSCPGIFVAGDTRTKQLRQIVTAASDGAVAAAGAASYINSIGGNIK